MDNFKAISFHFAKERKREPSLPPALAGLVLGALVFFPCLQKKKLRFEEIP